MKAAQYIDMIESATGVAELESLRERAFHDPEVKNASTNAQNGIWHALHHRYNTPLCEL